MKRNDAMSRLGGLVGVVSMAVVLSLAVTALPGGAVPAAAADETRAAVGVIEPAGEFSICMQGATHLLIRWDEVVFQLRGDTAELDAYVGERVRVSGSVLDYTVEGCAPLMTVEDVETLGRPRGR